MFNLLKKKTFKEKIFKYIPLQSCQTQENSTVHKSKKVEIAESISKLNEIPKKQASAEKKTYK